MYAPKAYSRLLSPQHISRERKDHFPKRNGTWCATYDDNIVFWWDQRKYKRTVTLDENSAHVGTIHTASGYSRFNAFCAECQDKPDLDIMAFESAIIEDDDSVIDSGNDAHDSDSDEDLVELREDPLTTDFRLDGPTTPGRPTPNIIEDEEDQMPQDASAEFLRWHHKLGHISPQ